jgi:diguanylate cyclase (GGDEF)-like protein
MNAADGRVEQLLGAMAALAEGRFDAPVTPWKTGDPLDRLLEGFSTMRDALASRESSMRETEQLTVLLQEVNEQLAASRQQLARLADQDPLTGLANRRSFLTHLQRRLAGNQRGGPPFVLLYLDLDGFKPINDQHGHRAGDAVLQAVANALRESLRGVDVPARVGGDEFAALLEGPRPTALSGLGGRILRRIEAPIDWEGAELSVGASIGVVLATDGYEDPEALLGRADQAMYAAKTSGGHRAVLDIDEPA